MGRKKKEVEDWSDTEDNFKEPVAILPPPEDTIPTKKKKKQKTTSNNDNKNSAATNIPTNKEISLVDINPAYTLDNQQNRDIPFKKLVAEATEGLHHSKDTISYKEEEGALGGKELTWKLEPKKKKKDLDSQQKQKDH